MCDRWDIGGLSTNVHYQTAMPTIFVYDGYPGGVGITRRGFEEFGVLVARRRAADRRVPVRGRLPVVRAVARSAATSTSRCTRPARSSVMGEMLERER